MTTQPPKDFLALSHGHEWVNFYESFDKLVQDHLSRSSELLRKAMSLPEVADREVAQIRDDLESRLHSEREQNSQMLLALKGDIAESHKQVVTLAQMIGTLMTDFDRLATTVDEAMTRADEMTAAEIHSTSAHEAADATAAPTATVDTDDADDADAWSNWPRPLRQRATTRDEIDLTALAAAEEATTDGSESGEDGDEPGPNGTERVRPHWLSMARTSNN